MGPYHSYFGGFRFVCDRSFLLSQPTRFGILSKHDESVSLLRYTTEIFLVFLLLFKCSAVKKNVDGINLKEGKKKVRYSSWKREESISFIPPSSLWTDRAGTYRETGAGPSINRWNAGRNAACMSVTVAATVSRVILLSCNTNNIKTWGGRSKPPLLFHFFEI